MDFAVPASQVAWTGGVVNSTRSNKYLNGTSGNDFIFLILKTAFAVIIKSHHKFVKKFVNPRGLLIHAIFMQLVLMAQTLRRR